MSLRAKILLILVPVVAGYAALDHFVQRLLLAPSFADLEDGSALRDAERTLDAIQGELEALELEAAGWANRDELVDFVHGVNDSYVEHRLGTPAFVHERLNLVYIAKPNGEALHAEARASETLESLTLNYFPKSRLRPGHTLLSKRIPSQGIDDNNAPTSGLVMTEYGPLLTASQPIHPDSGEGESLGRVILGRFLDDARIAAIAERTHVPFAVEPIAEIDRDKLPADLLNVIDDASGLVDPVLHPLDDSTVQAYMTIDDVHRNPALLVRSDVPREISQRGSIVIRYALFSTLAAGMLMLLVLLRTLQRSVLAPIEKLKVHAEDVGRTDDVTARLNLERDDEIGVLSREFDSMLAKLEASRAALVDTARAAGMSEIATGILHNVGNVLNSVRVSGSMVGEKLRSSQVEALARVSDMLEAHAEDLSSFVENDPRGAKLVPLLRALSEKLQTERQESLDELAALEEGLDHIRELVASQQEFAKRTTVLEVCRLSDIVDSAVTIIEKASVEAPQIAIHREYDGGKGFPVDRHKLLGILVNLIQNARHALEDADVAERKLQLRVSATDSGGARIEVEDNGIGIPADNLTDIFNHGFTTKPQGHGFGLHSAANSAVEIGGSLEARSEGPGQGATFVLELPRPVAQAA